MLPIQPPVGTAHGTRKPIVYTGCIHIFVTSYIRPVFFSLDQRHRVGSGAYKTREKYRYIVYRYGLFRVWIGYWLSTSQHCLLFTRSAFRCCRNRTLAFSASTSGTRTTMRFRAPQKTTLTGPPPTPQLTPVNTTPPRTV